MIKNFIKSPYLAIFFDIFIIFFLSIIIYLSRPISTSQVVFIPKGSVGEIISYLSNRNFNLSKIDKYALYFIGRPQSGWINMQARELSRYDFLQRLTTAKAALQDITLIPGETTIVFLNNIASELGLDAKKLNAEYNALSPLPDGFLIPNTYKIPIGISERHLAYYLVNSSKKAQSDLSMKIFGEYNEKKWFKILIIASVIQKEAASNDEMPLVASVVYNRLNKGMRLQMDGTLNYGLHSHETITPERIRTDTSGFNTYLNEGLPPTPVSSVSIDAIKAAINPAKSEFLYFVRDKKTKKHRFSKSLSEHNQNVNSQR
ncbi:endolytic transglycosylase MltG [Campylobacter sp. faydin G-140]|uniref:endolytic transglycosylase MltG n=1 Tax=Campylobacter anatolicus TaxID=2829105 RepID=UPI001B9F9270|nr:endolytic transglycosylase MltG [Campylobacter anatolicus]MBR8465914.1 endolytic transglycosylase MltG [Campylobacter anatolicus]